MSKGNMLLGHARGAVGSLVFSRANGKQIVRARAEVVKNPQTQAQMIQRIILNTVCQAYSKMSAITDHSFEGLEPGQESMSYFMKRNLSLLRTTLAEIGDLDAGSPCFSPLGTNGLASNTYVVAKGKLAEIIPEAVSSGGIAIALAGNTYQDVCNAIGAQRGDQLTIVTVCGQDYNNQKFNYSRIILDPRESDGTAADMDTAFLQEGVIVKPNDRNENTGHIYSYDSGEFLVSDAAGATNMAAAIQSRQNTDGTWLRSNAALILAEGASIGYSMQASLDAFASGGIDVENPLYLNNARKNAAKGTSPQPVPPTPVVPASIVSLSKDGNPVTKGSSIALNTFPEGGSTIAGTVSNMASGKTYAIAATQAVAEGSSAAGKITDSIAVSAQGAFDAKLDAASALPGDEPTQLCLLADNVVVEIWATLTT